MGWIPVSGVVEVGKLLRYEDSYNFIGALEPPFHIQYKTLISYFSFSIGKQKGRNSPFDCVCSTPQVTCPSQPFNSNNIKDQKKAVDVHIISISVLRYKPCNTTSQVRSDPQGMRVTIEGRSEPHRINPYINSNTHP